MLGARRTDRLDEAVRSIAAAGGRAASITMDVTRTEEVERTGGEHRRAIRTARHHDLQRRLRLLRHPRGYAAGDHAADDGRQFHGHVPRRARGASALSIAQQRSSDLRLVDRRPPWHSFHGRVFGDARRRRPGSPNRCDRNSPAPRSTPRASFRSRRSPSSARPWRAITVTRSAVSARSSPWSWWPSRSSTASAGRGPRCFRIARPACWRCINIVAPAFTDRLVRKYGRHRDTAIPQASR